MAGRPPDGDPDADGHGPPALHDGHETLLPSVTRSALSPRIPVARLDPSGFQDVSATPAPPRPADERPRGARAGDVIGSRYIVEGQLGRGGMGRVMRVRHSALGKVFALKLIRSSIAAHTRGGGGGEGGGGGGGGGAGGGGGGGGGFVRCGCAVGRGGPGGAGAR